jgi:hypothetical protein
MKAFSWTRYAVSEKNVFEPPINLWTSTLESATPPFNNHHLVKFNMYQCSDTIPGQTTYQFFDFFLNKQLQVISASEMANPIFLLFNLDQGFVLPAGHVGFLLLIDLMKV